jgi:hypothetical protein
VVLNYNVRGMACCGSINASGGGALGMNEGHVGGIAISGSGSSSSGDNLR